MSTTRTRTATGKSYIVVLTPSVEMEVLEAVYGILHGSVELTAIGGLTLAGASRPVAIYNMVNDNAPVPYVRLMITDTLPIDAEPYDYNTKVKAKSVRFMCDVFSDFHPEMLKISTVVQKLLENTAITTTHFQGSTWVTSADNLVENVVNPDRVYHHAAIRVLARMESNS